MGHADRSSRARPLNAQADRFAVDLILDCERAASRRKSARLRSDALGQDRMAALSQCRRPCAEPRRPRARFRTPMPINAAVAPQRVQPTRSPPPSRRDGGLLFQSLG